MKLNVTKSKLDESLVETFVEQCKINGCKPNIDYNLYYNKNINALLIGDCELMINQFINNRHNQIISLEEYMIFLDDKSEYYEMFGSTVITN